VGSPSPSGTRTNREPTHALKRHIAVEAIGARESGTNPPGSHGLSLLQRAPRSSGRRTMPPPLPNSGAKPARPSTTSRTKQASGAFAERRGRTAASPPFLPILFSGRASFLAISSSSARSSGPATPISTSRVLPARTRHTRRLGNRARPVSALVGLRLVSGETSRGTNHAAGQGPSRSSCLRSSPFTPWL
jgi:hypothetical protein